MGCVPSNLLGSSGLGLDACGEDWDDDCGVEVIVGVGVYCGVPKSSLQASERRVCDSG